MRNQLASIELRVLVSELKQLENSWLSQVYELAAANSKKGGKGIVLQLRIGVRPIAHSAMGGIVSTSEGNKRFLVIAAPSAVFSAVSKPETAEKPGGFCGMLRQHLGNVRLISVSQLGSERIVEVIFSLKQRRLRLIVELFSKGNLILVDEKNVIICCAEHQAWKDRTVRPGFAYQQPPATADFASMNEAQFGQAVLSSEKDSVVKALAVDLGLSGAYAEELCSAAVIDKDKKPQQLSQSELAALFSSLQKLLSRKPSPVAILDGSGRVAEVFPFPMTAAAAVKTKSFSSFNEAVEALAIGQLESSASASRESPSLRRIKELEIAIGQQQSTIAGMEKAVKEATAAAEAIYVHYQDVKGILDDYNALRKTFTPEQLREYFKGNKLVKNIDEKEGKITLEIVEPA